MEHFNTLQKKESQPTDRSRWRLWCMMLLAVLIGTSGMYGQVTWETIEVTPNVLPVAGNPGKLRLITRITGDITQPRIEVSLPSYIAYEAGRLYLNSNSNAETGITFDTSESGKVKISGISSLSSGARLEVVLDIKALKGAELNPDDVVAKMQFYDDQAKLGQEVSSASIVAKIPGISVTPEKISQYYADKDVVNTYKLFFGAIDVEVNGFELRLTVDKETSLDEIKINGGAPLAENAGFTKDVQTSQIVYNIPVTQALLGGVMASGPSTNYISFEAKSTAEALRKIKVEAKYPNFTGNYSQAETVELLMAYEVDGGEPVMNHYDRSNESYYTATPTIGAAKMLTDDIPMNLTTTSYARTVFQNTGTAAASVVELNVLPYGSFSIVDVNDVWYSIDGRTPQKIENITGIKDGGRPTYQGPLKTEYRNSPNAFRVRLPSTESVGIMEKLEVWVGTKNGQIYDVSNDLNVYTTDATTISGYRINISYCQSKAGIQGSSVAPSYTIYYQGYPHFKEVPNRKVYQQNDVHTQKILFGTNAGSKDKGKFEVELDLPPWLTLTDGVKWISSTTGSTIKTATKLSDTKYEFDYTTLSESYLCFDFKAESGFSTDQQGAVRYTIHHLPSGETSNRIEGITQVVQPVTLWVEDYGVTLVSPASGVEPFRLIRETTGYLDTGDTGTPDNPRVKAGENDNILHTVYINGDKGRIIWDGKVIGDYATGGTLYLVGELKELDKDKFIWSAISATVAGSNVTPSIIWDGTGQKFVIKYTGSLPQNALFHIELPFEVNGGNTDKMASVETRCYIHTASDKNPDMQTADDCLGNAVASSPLGVYSLDTAIGGIGGDNASEGFTSTGTKEFDARLYILRFDKLRIPYFTNEARILALPDIFTMTLPEGYEIVGNTVTLKYTPSHGSIQTISSYPITYDPALKAYTVDLRDIFYTEQTKSSTVPAGKFSFPDDKWYLQVQGKYRAQKSAQPVSTMNFQLGLTKEDRTPLTPLSRNVTFNYSGSSINISTVDAGTTKPLAGKDGLTYITLSNTASTALTKAWLYIDGDVQNAELRDPNTGSVVATATAAGWIELPGGLPASPTNSNYNLYVEHSGSSLADFPVRIQTVTDYNDGSYTPNTASDGLSDIPEEYKGRAATITFSPKKATVSGTLSSSTSTLVFDTPFTLSASLSSERSSGHLYNGSMVITIPAGYEYVPGVANTMEYNGTTAPLPSGITGQLTTMADGGANITLNVSEAESTGMLVGNTGKTAADNGKQSVKFNISLKPVCNITLTDRITAKIYGKDIYGSDADRNGDEIRLPRMTAAGVNFNFGITVTPAQKAFGYTVTDAKTIDVTLEKFTANAVGTTTYLEVALPKVLNLDGDKVTLNSTDLGISGQQLTISPTDNTLSGNTRTLKISIPVTEYNLSGLDNGDGKKVTFTIPVVYTVPVESSAEYTALVAQPEQDIEATVITDVSFGDASCGAVTPQPNPLASKAEKIAFLITDSDASFNILAGETTTVTIKSTSFDGTLSATNGTQSGNSLTIAPTAASYPDATAFEPNGKKEEKVTVAVSIGGTSYGTVELPYVVYPSLDFSLNASAQKLFCDTETTRNVTDLVGTYIQSGYSKWINVNFYEASDASFATPVTGKNFPIGTTTLKAVAKHKTETTIQSATPLDLIVTVNTSVAASLASDKASALVGETVNLTASGASSSSNGTHYQFYKGATALGSPTTAISYPYPVTSSDLGTLSFTVKVVNSDGTDTGLCGVVESAAVTVIVTDRPADISLGTPAGPVYDCGTTALFNLRSLITNPGSYGATDKFFWNTENNTAGATEFTSTINLLTTYTPGTTHTIHVWAKNAAGNFSANPASISVTAIQYTPAALGTVTGPNVEGTPGSNATATLSVTGTTGDKNSGDYTYRLYDTDVTAVAGEANTESGNSTTFNLSLPVPSLTTTSSTGYTEYKRYVTVQGACMETTREEVSIKVYPAAEISVSTTEEKFCTTDPALSGKKLSSYITGDAKTDWFDYTYSIAGGVTDAPLTDAVVLPTAPGTYNYTLKATNKLSGSTPATATLTIKVIAPVTLTVPAATVNAEQGQSLTLTASVTGSATGYELYRVGETGVVATESTPSFTLTLLAPVDNGQAYEAVNYYIKAIGEIPCADGASSTIEVRIYPAPVFTPTMPYENGFCITDSRLGATGAGINLWDYMVETPNTNWFTYTYGINEEATTEIPADGLVKLDAVRGSYTLKIKAVNKLSPSSLTPCEVPYTLAVFQNTAISNLTGYEVTEGEPVQIVVTADGEPILTYLWEKWDGSNWQPLTSLSGNSVTLTPSANITENGDRYRVVVTSLASMTGCDTDTREFKLNVKSAVTPPLGNYRVSWNVIGYGKVEVTADGISISNGSHVNKGAKLQIYATTWLSNALDKVTVNGTEYSSSPVTYTVGEENVDIVANFTGTDPNPIPDSNAEIENSTRIWTEGGYACIYTETATRVRIVTFNGRLVTDQKIGEGESRIQLPDGYYIVTLSDGTTKKIAIRNF